MTFEHGRPTYVIAEIGANHNGDMDLAVRMIDTAKSCGADAVKFQSWDTTIFSKTVYEQNYFLGDDYRQREDYTLKEIVEEFSLSFEQLRELSAYCRKVGIGFASTPFNVQQLEELLSLDPAFVKIASMDLTNPRLLQAAGRAQLPVLLSTGFSNVEEIDRAVRTIEAAGSRNIIILHCVSLYPPNDDEVNLNNMDMLRSVFGYPVGFSDHTLGTELSIAAMAKGAAALEKHFTLDKTMFGWDHKISSDAADLAVICRGRDRIHQALGTSRRVVGPRELKRRDEYRRSIVSARDIRAGETITDEAIDFRRPGTGLSPDMARIIVGATATRDIAADTLLALDDVGLKSGKS